MRALRGRRVVLIGDGLTMQWHIELMCYLTGVDEPQWFKASSPEWSTLVKKIQRLRRSGEYPLPTADDPGNTFKFHRLRLGNVNGEIVTYASHIFWPSATEGLLTMHAKVPEERADLVIINQAAHYNDPDLVNVNGSLSVDLAAYMKTCMALGLRCVLRESSAQHFWNANLKVQSGLYNVSVPSVCLSSAYNESQELVYDTVAEWRRDALRAALRSVGRPGSVMPIFKATMPMTFAHNGNDCTHYAGNMEYWEPWHAALFGLLENRPFVFAGAARRRHRT